MTNPFSAIFPSDVDPPVVLNGRYVMDDNDRRRLDNQIRAIQQYLLDQGASSNNDTLPTAFAMPNTDTSLPGGSWDFGIILVTGSPTATRTLTVPTTNGVAQRKVLINLTTQTLNIAPAGGGTASPVPTLQAAWLVFDGTNMKLAGGGNGTFGTDIASIDSANQKIVGFNASPLDTTGTVGQSKLWIWDAASTNKYSLRQITDDDKGAAYLPSLTFASGGASPVEIGATVTPFLNHNPVLTTAGLTAATIADSQGNGPTNRLGSSNGFQATLASYTMSSTPGTALIFSLQSTKNGVTKTATASITPVAAVFLGFGASTTATGFTASGANGTVTGPGASVTGFRSTSVLGNQSLFGTQTPSSNYLWAVWDSSLGGATLAQTKLTDKSTGFLIDMQVATSFTTTTVTGLTRTTYVARSTNNLGTTALQPYFAA